MQIKLSDKEKVIKRQVYTLLDMVGDIGGLHDGLIIIIGLFVTIFNSSMFEGALALSLFKF